MANSNLTPEMRKKIAAIFREAGSEIDSALKRAADACEAGNDDAAEALIGQMDATFVKFMNRISEIETGIPHASA